MSRKHLTVGNFFVTNHESEPRGQSNLRDARHGSIECRPGREANLEQRQSGRPLSAETALAPPAWCGRAR